MFLYQVRNWFIVGLLAGVMVGQLRPLVVDSLPLKGTSVVVENGKLPVYRHEALSRFGVYLALLVVIRLRLLCVASN